jgi:hypothetical protein
MQNAINGRLGSVDLSAHDLNNRGQIPIKISSHRLRYDAAFDRVRPASVIPAHAGIQ